MIALLKEFDRSLHLLTREDRTLHRGSASVVVSASRSVILKLVSVATTVLVLLQVPIMCAITIVSFVNGLFMGSMMGGPMVVDPVWVITGNVAIAIPKRKEAERVSPWITIIIRTAVIVSIRVAI